MKQSGGTDRTVPLEELKAWSRLLEKLKKDLQEAMGNEALRWDAMFHARFMADFLRDKIEPYIDEKISIQRLTEDAAILDEQEKLMRVLYLDWKEQYFQALSESPRKETPDEDKTK